MSGLGGTGFGLLEGVGRSVLVAAAAASKLLVVSGGFCGGSSTGGLGFGLTSGECSGLSLVGLGFGGRRGECFGLGEGEPASFFSSPFSGEVGFSRAFFMTASFSFSLEGVLGTGIGLLAATGLSGGVFGAFSVGLIVCSGLCLLRGCGRGLGFGAMGVVLSSVLDRGFGATVGTCMLVSLILLLENSSLSLTLSLGISSGNGESVARLWTWDLVGFFLLIWDVN